jgi:hypothetical protein
VVHAHVTIAITLGPAADAPLSSALAAPGVAAHNTGQADDLVSDADEFTSVPSTAAAPTMAGGVATLGVEANNGHTTLAG